MLCCFSISVESCYQCYIWSRYPNIKLNAANYNVLYLLQKNSCYTDFVCCYIFHFQDTVLVNKTPSLFDKILRLRRKSTKCLCLGGWYQFMEGLWPLQVSNFVESKFNKSKVKKKALLLTHSTDTSFLWQYNYIFACF